MSTEIVHVNAYAFEFYISALWEQQLHPATQASFEFKNGRNVNKLWLFFEKNV